jgi:hypothetical protein
MRLFRWPIDSGGGWLGPALAGGALIAAGVLLYAHPELLAYFVAGVFVFAGAGLLALAWRLRTRVTHRRMHGTWRVWTPTDEGDRDLGA